jgi:hypothetical protein
MTVDETDSSVDSATAATPRNVPKPGHLPVDELLFERQGPPSPFGEDTEFPMPLDKLSYRHPSAESRPVE